MYEYNATLVRVVDGDTIDVDVDLGMRVHTKARLRLLDINTPEMHGVKKDSEEYQQGIEAKNFVEAWFMRFASGYFRINTQKDRKGKYGRWLAEVYSVDEKGRADRCLNDELEDRGWGG